MIRHVKDDIYQIGSCVIEETGAEAVHIYVMLNDGHPILIDCGSHLHRGNLMAELDTVLNGAIPQWIFLTHTELPHSGNLQQVAEKWPDIQVKVSNVLLSYIEIAPVIPLEQITMAIPGSEWVIGQRRLISVDALLKDQPGSQWIYDPATKTMFTGDGFGYYHPVEQCGHFSDEIEGGIQTEQFQHYHHDAFRFLRWVRADKFNPDVDRVFRDYPVET
ncbi:MAG: MBL fold metallo-hydrolase, partial [Anaerolineae bacterium]|nr:MBL fold metallo-hydrolase [Anaerolineae bacterium]